ncbi:MAG: GspE/PulE family protein [Thermodesulfobacteriota bacterium]
MERKESKERDPKMGAILVKEGLITQDQLREAITKQAAKSNYIPIGQILLEMKVITDKQLNFVLQRFGKWPRIGDILVRSGLVTQGDIKRALKHQQESGLRLGEALVKLGCISEKGMKQALCTQLNIPFVDLNDMKLDWRLCSLINKKYAQKHQIVPISKIGTTLTLAMNDPTDTEVIEELQRLTGFTINVITSTRSAMLHAFVRLYEDQGVTEETSSTLQLMDDDSPENEISDYLNSQQIKNADALVGHIIRIAIKNSASDIHLETTDRRMYVRFRIDGLLQDLQLGTMEEKLSSLKRQIVSRIKILGNLDIAEKRRPQDGSFRAEVGSAGNHTKIDFRVSIVPGYYGENVVLRILDSRKAPKSIDQLGFSPRINKGLHALLKRNTGIVLVTGPTGSGKSTTLYGSLMTAYRPGIKILTAEDPIEYVYEKITQCQVNPTIGNTFANFVRAFLRQDPEVILVGEIRDSETAEMSFRAAQTGHLVLSTLHTNDALGAVPRLLGLGIDPGLISSCLAGVLAQRLIRQVCAKCKRESKPPEELMKEFFPSPPTDIRWVAGHKCADCNYTGYKGRAAVAELWIPGEKEFILINKGADINDLRESVYENENTVLMAEDAISKLREEKTTLEELARTIPFSSIYDFRRIQKGRG